MSEPELSQAVILAGGRGTRTRPLTDTRPKPMIEFEGKPFLEYLLEYLREQGITRVLLLLGYLGDMIHEYFGDGGRFGVEIEYSATGEANKTGKRIKIAAPMIAPHFLMMYCDNYCPLDVQDMWGRYLARGVTAQFAVYSNKDEYTRSNLRIDENGIVLKYDKSRSSPGLQGVDIGFAIFKKSVVDYLPDENVSFEATVYPRLVESGRLGAYVTDHRYYSVGSLDRLETTRQFLRREPAIILDRDGVLNRKAPKADYIKHWKEFEWLPGALEALALLKQAGYRIIVITNQAGIARGVMTEADLAEIHANMKRRVAEAGAEIDAIYYCPHGWNDGCDCRKPAPGMLFQAQREFHLDLTRTCFVGDDARDKQAGAAAGCRTIRVSSEFPLLRAVQEQILATEAT